MSHDEQLAQAARLDAQDPLAELAESFVRPADRIYLDGNSLGMAPRAAMGRARQLIEQEWATGLVGSWDSWLDLPLRVGDRLGSDFLGAAPGQVAISDSTTVNLFKLAAAVLDGSPRERRVIVGDRGNFPTDRYVLEGLAASRGFQLRSVDFDPVHGPDAEALSSALDDRVALVLLSQVDYRSSALADMAAINRAAAAVGARVLWDLSHAAGVVPIRLDQDGCDLAVGCTYKYLAGGPGAPAFLYVRRELQPQLRQPVWGWFGQRDQFLMGPHYQPLDDVRRYLTGTPPILGLRVLEASLEVLAAAGVEALRAKAEQLTDFAVGLFDLWLVEAGFQLTSPRAAASRGAHIGVSHPDAESLCLRLLERGVITDFRQPDRIRLGMAPATTRFRDVCEGVWSLRQLALEVPAGSAPPAGGG